MASKRVHENNSKLSKSSKTKFALIRSDDRYCVVPVSCIEDHNPDKEIEIEGEYLIKFRGNIYGIKICYLI